MNLELSTGVDGSEGSGDETSAVRCHSLPAPSTRHCHNKVDAIVNVIDTAHWWIKEYL